MAGRILKNPFTWVLALVAFSALVALAVSAIVPDLSAFVWGGLITLWVAAALVLVANRLMTRPRGASKSQGQAGRAQVGGGVPKLLAKEGELYHLEEAQGFLVEGEKVDIDEWVRRHRAAIESVTGPPAVRRQRLAAWPQAQVYIWADTAIAVDTEGQDMRILRNMETAQIIQGWETLRAVVDLRTQSHVQRDVRAKTADGIDISTDVFATFQIERGGLPSLRDPYPALNDAVLHAVYNAPADNTGRRIDWTDAVMRRVAGVFRDVIARYGLHELYEPGESEQTPRQAIIEAMTTPALVTELRRTLGVNLLSASVGNLEVVDARVRDAIRQLWQQRHEEALRQQLGPPAAERKGREVAEMVAPVRDALNMAGDAPELRLHLEEMRAQLEELAEARDTLQAQLDDSQRERDQLHQQLTALTKASGESRRATLLHLVEVFDLVDLAVARTPPETFKHDRYAQGLKIIQKDMLSRFASLGLEEVPGVGHPFDTSLHHAVQRDGDSAQPEGAVSKVERRGFFYQTEGGKVLLRPAEVWVADGVSASEAERKRAERSRQPHDAPPSAATGAQRGA